LLLGRSLRKREMSPCIATRETQCVAKARKKSVA
jgi:hypothetical protein